MLNLLIYELFYVLIPAIIVYFVFLPKPRLRGYNALKLFAWTWASTLLAFLVLTALLKLIVGQDVEHGVFELGRQAGGALGGYLVGLWRYRLKSYSEAGAYQ